MAVMMKIEVTMKIEGTRNIAAILNLVWMFVSTADSGSNPIEPVGSWRRKDTQ